MGLSLPRLVSSVGDFTSEAGDGDLHKCVRLAARRTARPPEAATLVCQCGVHSLADTLLFYLLCVMPIVTHPTRSALLNCTFNRQRKTDQRKERLEKTKKHPDFYRKKGFLAAQNPLQMGYERYARLFCCFRGLLPSKKRRKYLFVAFNVRSDPSLSKKRFSTFLSLLMYSRVPPPPKSGLSTFLSLLMYSRVPPPRKSGLSTFLSLLMCSRVPPPPKSGVSTFPSPSIYKSHF